MNGKSLYLFLALVSLVGIALTAVLIFKASRLPQVYSPRTPEELSTSSAVIKESSPSTPAVRN